MAKLTPPQTPHLQVRLHADHGLCANVKQQCLAIGKIYVLDMMEAEHLFLHDEHRLYVVCVFVCVRFVRLRLAQITC